MSRLGEIHKKPDALARMRMSQGQIGKRVPPRTPAQVEKLRNTQLGLRSHYSRKAKEQWQNPEVRDKQTKAILAGSHIRPTKAEYDLGKLIELACPGEYKYTGDGVHIINGMCPDFSNVNGQKKVIEMFGDYWHQGKDPQVKIDKYAEFGFDCLVIWEGELKGKLKAELIAIIKVFNSESNDYGNNIVTISPAVEQQLKMF